MSCCAPSSCPRSDAARHPRIASALAEHPEWYGGMATGTILEILSQHRSALKSPRRSPRPRPPARILAGVLREQSDQSDASSPPHHLSHRDQTAPSPQTEQTRPPSTCSNAATSKARQREIRAAHLRRRAERRSAPRLPSSSPKRSASTNRLLREHDARNPPLPRLRSCFARLSNKVEWPQPAISPADAHSLDGKLHPHPQEPGRNGHRPPAVNRAAGHHPPHLHPSLLHRPVRRVGRPLRRGRRPRHPQLRRPDLHESGPRGALRQGRARWSYHVRQSTALRLLLSVVTDRRRALPPRLPRSARHSCSSSTSAAVPPSSRPTLLAIQVLLNFLNGYVAGIFMSVARAHRGSYWNNFQALLTSLVLLGCVSLHLPFSLSRRAPRSSP